MPEGALNNLNLKSQLALNFSHYFLRIGVFFVAWFLLALYPTETPAEGMFKAIVCFIIAIPIAWISEELTANMVARSEQPKCFPPPWEVSMPMDKVVESLRPILERNDVTNDPHIKVSGNIGNLSIRMSIKSEMLSDHIGQHLDVFIKLDRIGDTATAVTVAYCPSGNWHWLEEDLDTQIKRLRAGAYSPVVFREVRARRTAIDSEMREALQKSTKQSKKEARKQVPAVDFPALGTDMDQAQVDYCLQLARQGNAEAQFRMGILHDHDGQMDTDVVKSEKYYQFAAEQGHPHAQYRLAMLYWPVTGVEERDQMFVQWCQESATNGFRDAQNQLGAYYYGNEGGVQDFAKAQHWWLKAARQKSAAAQMGLGLMYLNHQVQQDGDEDARFWFTEAARQCNADAMFYLGRMYEEGIGIGRDAQEAQNWYRRGAEFGNEAAKGKLSTFS